LQSKRYAKSIANAFVFNTFFGGEPRDWAETPARPFPTVSKCRCRRWPNSCWINFCRPQNRVCSVSATRAARRQKDASTSWIRVQTQLNAGITAIRADGTWQRINNQWTGK